MDFPPFPRESVYAALVAPPTVGGARPRPSAWWESSIIIVTASATAACAIMLYSSTPPAVMILLFAGTVWALGILGAAWLVLTVVGWVQYRAWKLPSIAVAIVAATAVLVVLSVPFRVAFAVSKGPLTDIATACSAAPAGGWVGAYELDGVRAVDGGCLIYVEGGFLDQVGFAHMPDGAPELGPPAGEQQIGYAELDGDWYTFVHRF